MKKVNKTIKIIEDVNEGINQMTEQYKTETNWILRRFFGHNKYLQKIKENHDSLNKIINKVKNSINDGKLNMFQTLGHIFSEMVKKPVRDRWSKVKEFIKKSFIELIFLLCFLCVLLDVRVFMVLMIVLTVVQIYKEGIEVVKQIKEFLRYIFCKLIFTRVTGNFVADFLINYARNILILWFFTSFKVFLYIVVILIRFTFRIQIEKDIIGGLILTIVFVIFLLSYRYIRTNYLVRFSYVFIFWIMYVSIENLAVFKDVRFIIRIYRSIMFFYNLYNGDWISYLSTFLSTGTRIMPYWGVEAKMIIECGTCTLNNIDDMIQFLITMRNLKRDKVPYTCCPTFVKDKFNADSYGKFEIIKLPKVMKCDHDVNKEKQFLMNFGFQINGFNVYENTPLKLHRCRVNELESLYRQIQAGIFYDKKIAKEFIKFSHNIINTMVENYYSNNPHSRMITMEQYLQKIGPRKYEYMQGLEEYYRGDKLKMAYKMHNKDDEKQYLDFNDPKSKSRNICAQLPMGKILLGIPCELGMDVLHSQPWCGPGNTFVERCKKFCNWIINIIDCEVICCDGSSFDSTQHRLFIEEIDSYFLNRILDYNTYLFDYFDEKDLRRYISQSQFFIFSKYDISYRIQGTQLSGRMNTCLCNTLRSALYIKFIMYKIGILDKQEFNNFEVNGDDQIIFIAKVYVKKYIEYGYFYVYANKDSNQYHGLGQICKIFDHYPHITGAEYLSCYLLYDKERNKCWMVRKPQRFFQMIPFTFRVGLGKKQNVDYQRFKLGKEVVIGALNELKGIKLYEILLNQYSKLLDRKINYLEKNYFFHAKTIRYLNSKINKEKAEYIVKGRGLQDFDEKFNDLFEEFLNKKFNINSDDIIEYKIAVEQCNDLDGEIIVSLVDKFYPNIKSTHDFTKQVNSLHIRKTYDYVQDKYSDWILPDHFIANY